MNIKSELPCFHFEIQCASDKVKIIETYNSNISPWTKWWQNYSDVMFQSLYPYLMFFSLALVHMYEICTVISGVDWIFSKLHKYVIRMINYITTIMLDFEIQISFFHKLFRYHTRNVLIEIFHKISVPLST